MHQQLLTVLIIDDDEDDRFFLEQAFRTDSPHTQIHLAESGQQALDLLESIQPLPDGIVLDLNMPAMNGFELLEHLKRSTRYQAIPIVILTTSNADSDKDRARQLGATDFITKPVAYDDLSQLANRLRLRLIKLLT